jgi:signal transduction histidine kinase
MSALHLMERDLASLFEAHWSSEGLDTFFEKLLQACVHWFDAAGVSLFLKDDLDDRFHLVAQDGPASHVPIGTVLTPGEGLAGAAISEGKPKLVQDEGGSARVSSAMIVPLATPESGCIGVLNVSRPEGAAKYAHSDLATADSLARYVALAVNNARLFTRLNQAAAQSRAISAKLDAIISCLGVGVLVVNEQGEVTGWNPEASKVLGIQVAAGSQIANLESPAPLAAALQATYEEAVGGVNRAQRAAGDGEKAWSIVGSPLPTGGATLAIQDVSDEERAHQELSRMTRLAEIGQMTAAVAHEIRNPLTGIRSAAQMVQACGGESVEFGAIIEEEALKLNALCDQFLEFARPLELTRRPVDLAHLVGTIAQRHAQDFRDAKVNLFLEIDPNLPKIEADPLRLEQVCRNLLLNALQACGAGAQVTVTVDAQGLTVRDTGMGIEPGMREKLFTPFFTTKANGTGLGLPNVRKIIDAHGWDVQVESEPDMGSVFYVRFARRRAA